MPVLAIHGERDEIIPLELGRAVYEAAPSPKSFYLAPGAGHNDCPVVGGAGYFARLNEFARESTSLS